ncbi:MAG: MarR family transcriptional regulator [Pseudomonadota bacterium]
MIDKRDDDFLGQNIKGMMMTLLAHWNAQMDDARSETEFATIRPADMRVFGQLRGRTVKLSMIHRAMGFSRQAAQQAVDRLVEHEMISVQPDPDSKRDKIVTITEKGQRWRSIAAAQIRLIEGQVAESLGEEAKERLRHALIDLMRATR